MKVKKNLGIKRFEISTASMGNCMYYRVRCYEKDGSLLNGFFGNVAGSISSSATHTKLFNKQIYNIDQIEDEIQKKSNEPFSIILIQPITKTRIEFVRSEENNNPICIYDGVD
jgi:hypothetical protein